MDCSLVIAQGYMSSIWACIFQWSYEPCRVTHDGLVIGKSSDKTWSTKGGNGNPFPVLFHGQYEKAKDLTLEDELPSSEGVPYATGEEQRAVTGSFRKNEAAGPKWKQHSFVGVSGGESKVWHCKEQYFLGTWNVRSMKQGKLDVVKQEVARVFFSGIFIFIWKKCDKCNLDFSCYPEIRA